MEHMYSVLDIVNEMRMNHLNSIACSPMQHFTYCNQLHCHYSLHVLITNLTTVTLITTCKEPTHASKCCTAILCSSKILQLTSEMLPPSFQNSQKDYL